MSSDGGAVVGMGKHRVLMRRDWEDEEPERLTVSVESSWDTGERFTVFTTSSTWLDRKQVLELREYLGECLSKMAEDDEVDKAVALD